MIRVLSSEAPLSSQDSSNMKLIKRNGIKSIFILPMFTVSINDLLQEITDKYTTNKTNNLIFIIFLILHTYYKGRTNLLYN
ncbi:hypothetical protein SDC9_176598 [bioreactor metagenome]|uniref:Uncharacterized protein n=1 Tax=bioreactor metagenome TaxID=1076179 RepID=A0A645GQI3_9ZZZZ